MNKTILVVDNEPDIVETISIMLGTEGYNVLKAESGEEALHKVRLMLPDLMVLDVVLPRMNGKEVACILKKEDLYKDIPIILITAQTQAKDLEALKGSPADFYLIKPFDLEELKRKIEQLLKKAARPY